MGAFDSNENLHSKAPFVLEARAISKSFGSASGTRSDVLTEFSYKVCSGDLAYVTGPNGIGKTVLAKCLSGLLQIDSGTISINGEEFAQLSRKTARARGIEYLPQQLPNPSSLDGLELLSLSRSGTAMLFCRRAIRRAAQQAVSQYEIDLDIKCLERSLATLAPPELRRLYLLRALMSGARLLILDEPTSGLTENEAQSLVSTLERLTEARYSNSAVPQSSAAQRPRSAPLTDQRPAILLIAHPGQVPLDDSRVRIMTSSSLIRVSDTPHSTALSRTERIEVALSWKPAYLILPNRGTISLAPGRIIAIVGESSREFFDLFAATKRRLVDLGDQSSLTVRILPFDGNNLGLALSRPVFENCLVNQWDRWTGRFGIISKDRARTELSRSVVSTLAISPSDVDIPASQLSGGNQQLLLIGRETFGDVNVFLAGDLFRGLSDTNVSKVADLINRKATEGTCVVLFSVMPNLEDLLADEIWRFEQGKLHPQQVIPT